MSSCERLITQRFCSRIRSWALLQVQSEQRAMRPLCHMSIHCVGNAFTSATEHHSTTGACHQEGKHPNPNTTRHSREKTPLTEFMVVKEVCLFAAGSNTFSTAAISTVNFIFGAQRSPCSLFKWLSTVPAQFSTHHLLSNTNDRWGK